jgi:hypothetical protein
MSAATRRKTLYVVQRAGIQTGKYADFPAFYPSGEEEGGSLVPERAFATRAAAEAHCRELELQARHTLPPVRFMPYILPLSARAAADALRAAGLEPPSFGEDAGENDFRGRMGHLAVFRRWWAEHGAEITPEQNAALWAAFFPEIKLYTVTKLTLED